VASDCRAIPGSLDEMTQRPLRVLIVASHPVQYASPVFRQFAKDPRLEIQVAYGTLQGAESAIDPEFGVQIAWDVPLLEGYSWVLAPNLSWRPGVGRFFGLINTGLWHMIRTRQYDAVVSYAGYAYATFWIVAVAAKWSGIPLLFGTDATGLAPRVGSGWKAKIKKLLLPKIFSIADMVIAPSAATRDYVNSLGIPLDQIALTPFVVDNDWWRSRAATADRRAVRKTWRIPVDAMVVLFCGKFQPWKRPQDALRAFARAAVPEAYMVFAGTGPLSASLKTEAESLGVTARVRFLGFVNQTQLPEIYTASDLMVLPSQYDACPAVVCEAMLCGCPVVISDEVRGRFDIVTHGVTGFIFPCGDIPALAGILSAALADRAKLSGLGQVATARMETWSPRENVEATVGALERAIRFRLARKNGHRVKMLKQ
jgi:glycosyltransferase involved in cell wall biosynthesis